MLRKGYALCSPEFLKKGPLSRSLSVDSALSNSRCRRVQLLYLIALDPRGVQDKYSSECGMGSGSIRECGFGRRAFFVTVESGRNTE